MIVWIWILIIWQILFYVITFFAVGTGDFYTRKDLIISLIPFGYVYIFGRFIWRTFRRFYFILKGIKNA